MPTPAIVAGTSTQFDAVREVPPSTSSIARAAVSETTQAGSATRRSVPKASARESACTAPTCAAAAGEDRDRGGRAEERDRAEDVQEERQVPGVRADGGEHQAPGFQIMSARIASMPAPAPHESASVTRVANAARSSALGRIALPRELRASAPVFVFARHRSPPGGGARHQSRTTATITQHWRRSSRAGARARARARA